MDKLLSGRRILVVEDEMMILMLIEDMLEELGCQSVTAASTVERALTLIDGNTFDAALLDMNLNGANSQDVAAGLATQGVPFAFSTGYSTLEMAPIYRDRPVLKKPFAVTELAGIFKLLLPR